MEKLIANKSFENNYIGSDVNILLRKIPYHVWKFTVDSGLPADDVSFYRDVMQNKTQFKI